MQEQAVFHTVLHSSPKGSQPHAQGLPCEWGMPVMQQLLLRGEPWLLLAALGLRVYMMIIQLKFSAVSKSPFNLQCEFLKCVHIFDVDRNSYQLLFHLFQHSMMQSGRVGKAIPNLLEVLVIGVEKVCSILIDPYPSLLVNEVIAVAVATNVASFLNALETDSHNKHINIRVMWCTLGNNFIWMHHLKLEIICLIMLPPSNNTSIYLIIPETQNLPKSLKGKECKGSEIHLEK